MAELAVFLKRDNTTKVKGISIGTQSTKPLRGAVFGLGDPE
jgi:hypothetical protein